MGWKYSKKRYKSIGERTVSGKSKKDKSAKLGVLKDWRNENITCCNKN